YTTRRLHQPLAGERYMAEKFELTDEMRAQIGTESVPWTMEVTTTSVRAFARGVGYTDPVYFDIDAARQAGYRNLPAPPTSPGPPDDTFSQAKAARQGVNHGLKGLLDGGTETEYFADICAGDTLTIVSRIAGLDVRTSPTLGKMLIMTSESTFTNQEGAVTTSWEWIKEGDALPELRKRPDVPQLVKYAAGSGDFNPLHYDYNFPQAKQIGSIIVHRPFQYASLGELVSNWLGHRGRIKLISCQYRGMDLPHQDMI